MTTSTAYIVASAADLRNHLLTSVREEADLQAALWNLRYPQDSVKAPYTVTPIELPLVELRAVA